MQLCIFNPEHDLCLANGRAHYVPPRSAIDFARRGASLMQVLYPDSRCLSVYDIIQSSTLSDQFDRIVPWGWNLTLKYELLKQGVPATLMPSDEVLSQWRMLQHRTTILPLQPQSRAATTAEEVRLMISQYRSVVMKAPWSGAGRGLRWVTDRLGEQDVSWLNKVVREQRCVIVEPRREVAADFALEYIIDKQGLQFLGYSLFESALGVYQGIRLLPDVVICRRVGITSVERQGLEDWLCAHVSPFYQGPLGVDFILDTQGRRYLSEMNLRHTMGWVAHEYLAQHPDADGSLFNPSVAG